LKGARSDELVVTQVSSAVNNARNKGPECNEPAA
jgi:putative SOS response-associated peptidase YedK